MKKIFLLALAAVLTLASIGCERKTYELPWDEFCHDINKSSTVKLKAEDRKYIINLLNQATWTDDVSDCNGEFIFYTQKQEVRYCSEHGVFDDVTNQRSSTALEEQRVYINTVLGVNNSKDI